MEPEFKIKLKREDMPKTQEQTKISVEADTSKEEQHSGQKQIIPEIPKIEKKKIKSKSTRRKPQRNTQTSKTRTINQKNANTSRSSKSEKNLKIKNNWVLCWSKIENTINSNDSIWIKRWVKISEGENLNKKKNEKKKIPKIFKCSNFNCQKIFWDENKLKKHMVVHGEKQFVCEYEKCGKSFLDKSKLKRHRLVHTKERHYKCEICSKRFSLDFNLKTHIRTHTGLKPFACEFPNCNRRFTQSSNLAAHQKIHYKIGGKVRKSRKKKKKISNDGSKKKNNDFKKTLDKDFVKKQLEQKKKIIDSDLKIVLNEDLKKKNEELKKNLNYDIKKKINGVLKKENGIFVLKGSQKIKLEEKNFFEVHKKKNEEVFQINKNNSAIDFSLAKIQNKNGLTLNVSDSQIRNNMNS